MGNYASCVLGGANGKHNKVARVIFPSREIMQLHKPTKAAELMLEIPNYFLVNSKSLQIGKKFSPLNADEDVEFGNVYVMFPMHKVNSYVSAADMGALYLAAKRGSSAPGKVRVVPAYSNDLKEAEPPAQTHEKKGEFEGVEELLLEIQHRSSLCRSRKPSLETIEEEPVYSR